MNSDLRQDPGLPRQFTPLHDISRCRRRFLRTAADLFCEAASSSAVRGFHGVSAEQNVAPKN